MCCRSSQKNSNTGPPGRTDAVQAQVQSSQGIKIIGYILFVIGFVELYACVDYIRAFNKVQTSACCGLIAQESDGDWEDDFACKESDIGSRGIEYVVENGNVICAVGGVTCNSYLKDGARQDFADCIDPDEYMEISKFNYFCDEDELEDAGDNAVENAIQFSIFCAVGIVFSSLYCLCETFGSGCCQRNVKPRKSERWCCLIVQVSWMVLMLVTYEMITSNAANKGYDAVLASETVTSGMEEEALYVEENCVNYPTIWVAYIDLELSPGNKSEIVAALCSIGLLLSVIEAFLTYKHLKKY
eukprot:131207_1